MQKLFILLFSALLNLCVAFNATSANISDVLTTKASEPSEHLLLLTNISTKLSAAAYIHLRYFPSHSCSGDPIAETQVFEKVSPAIIKQRALLKILGAAVYSLGAEKVGDDGMSRVSSIAVRVGARFGLDESAEGNFYIPELAKFTKSYCIDNVVCTNHVCQSIEQFVPQVAFQVTNNSSEEIGAALSSKLDEALQFIDKYNHTEFAKQSTISNW